MVEQSPSCANVMSATCEEKTVRNEENTFSARLCEFLKGFYLLKSLIESHVRRITPCYYYALEIK